MQVYSITYSLEIKLSIRVHQFYCQGLKLNRDFEAEIKIFEEKTINSFPQVIWIEITLCYHVWNMVAERGFHFVVFKHGSRAWLLILFGKKAKLITTLCYQVWKNQRE